MRAALLELPFKRVDTPSLGLTLLRDIALERGHEATITYANFRFADKIGEDRYQRILDTPSELLLGDLVFAGAAFDRHVSPSDQQRLESLSRIGNRCPDLDLIMDLPQLQVLASAYCGEVAESVHDAEAYCVSAMFQITPSLAVAKALKARRPDSVVILGGPHCAGSMGRAILRLSPWIDYVCTGEGEWAFPAWLDAMTRSLKKSVVVPGVASRNVPLPPAAPSVPLDSLPMPRYRDWCRQRGVSTGSKFVAPFEASRGCWFGEHSHCIFCGLNGEMIKFRAKCWTRVLAEIEGLKQEGALHLEAADQILNPKYLINLFPEIARRKLGMTFFFEVKSTLSKAQLATLADAGVVAIQPGIESLSSPLLRILRKGAKTYHNIRLLKWCAELGINASWNCLVGIPGESTADYSELIDLIPHVIHLQPPNASIRPIRVDRFSPLWKEAVSGVGRPIVPAPAYQVVYGEDPELLASLAYHFDFADEKISTIVADTFISVMNGWCDAVGTVSLTFSKARRGMAAWVCDRRQGRSVVYELTDEVANVLERCDSGLGRDELARDTGLPSPVVMNAVDWLLDRHLLLQVDDRLLSLPVDMTAVIGDQPGAIGADLAHTIYCSRMLALSESSARLWPRRVQADGAGTHLQQE